MDKEIVSIEYNFGYTQESSYAESFTVGHKEVVSIEEHPARGDGDRWYYDVHFENGSVKRIFNPNIVDFK